MYTMSIVFVSLKISDHGQQLIPSNQIAVIKLLVTVSKKYETLISF